MNGPEQRDIGRELDAPERLVQALKEFERRNDVVPVPPEVDEAILRAGRDRIKAGAVASTAIQSKRVSGRLEAWWLAAAAGVSTCGRRWAWAVASLIVLLGVWLARDSFAVRGLPLAEDLNDDGRVDIRDALAFAQQLKALEPSPPRLDLNQDGTVDQRDVEVMVSRAVALDSGGDGP